MTEHRFAGALRATAWVGGAAVLNIVVGLVRTKLAALMLGPDGIGIIGLLLNLVTLVATVGQLGLTTALVRQIADALGRKDPDDAAAGLRTVVTILTGLSAICAIPLWLFRSRVAADLLGQPQLADLVGWSAVAVVLTILAGIPVAVLNGHRRLKEMAVLQLLGGVGGTVLGLSAIAFAGADGIAGYLVAAPLGLLAAGLILLGRVDNGRARWGIESLRGHAVPMVRLGIPLMLSGVSMTAALLVLRVAVGDRLSTAELGYFTAAWTLSTTYVAVLVQALGTDFFPRLVAVVDRPADARKLVADQWEFTLRLALPVVFIVQAVAPLLVILLYSSAFVEAAAIVRWQVAGDVLRIASLAFGYLLLAQGRGLTFWACDTFFAVIFVSCALGLIPFLGLEATGIAYVTAYAAYFVLVASLARGSIGFGLSPVGAGLIVAVMAGLLVIGMSARYAPGLGWAIGLILAGLAGFSAVRSLGLVAFLPPRLRGFLHR